MSRDSDSDEAPDELTFEQGNKQEEEFKMVQRTHKARFAQEKKEKRRLWAQRRAQQESASEAIRRSKKHEDLASDPGRDKELTAAISGMLPSNIVSFLATREKQVFTSDSEKETVEDETATVRKKKKQKTVGTNAVLLKDLPPPVCVGNSMEFLKRRKTRVARSQAVLRNANQTLRLLSSPGNLLSRSSRVLNRG